MWVIFGTNEKVVSLLPVDLPITSGWSFGNPSRGSGDKQEYKNVSFIETGLEWLKISQWSIKTWTEH